MTIHPQERDIEREIDLPLMLEAIADTLAQDRPDAAASAAYIRMAATRLRAQPSPREEHGWVIEGAWSDPASPAYWAGSSLWMADHMCAIRFAREHDAKQAASAMLDGMNIRICEHVWTGDIRESVSSENIRQSVSVSPREVALEKALRQARAACEAVLHMRIVCPEDAQSEVDGCREAAEEADRALSPAQKGEAT